MLDGISIFFGGDAAGATGNDIHHNRVEANGRDGVRLGGGSSTAHHNSVCAHLAGSGINVGSSGNNAYDNQVDDGMLIMYTGAPVAGVSLPGVCAPNNPAGYTGALRES